MISHANDFERLGLLVPELADRAHPDMQAYALAYVERYRGDVLHLEQEWAFLAAALVQAWQQEAYDVVVALAAGLALPAGRLSNLAEAEAILRLGVEASRRAENWPQLARFLNRLSGLLLARGSYQEGWRLWSSSLELAQPTACSLGLWEPLSSFAYIADAYLTDRLGVRAADARFIQTIHTACQSDEPENQIVALFVRGFYARLVGDTDQARADLSRCLRGLALQASATPAAPHHQLLTFVAQAELARAQGDYTRSQACAETAIALAQVFSDHYTVAALLIDQGLFVWRQGQVADLFPTYQRLRVLACQAEAPRVGYYSRLLQQHLPERSFNGLYEPLSEREREVLELVGAGFSNQEIARRLVITPGTVKKHLEHIYIKLDVHSRTAALARARDLNLLA